MDLYLGLYIQALIGGSGLKHQWWWFDEFNCTEKEQIYEMYANDHAVICYDVIVNSFKQ
jgi:hypothetical protein